MSYANLFLATLPETILEIAARRSGPWHGGNGRGATASLDWRRWGGWKSC